MTLQTFPAYVVLLFTNFSEGESVGILRTQMESVFAKQRPVNSKPIKTVTVTYGAKSLADYNNFMAWVRTNINFGSDWFTWVDPIDSLSKRAMIVGGIDRIKRSPEEPTLGWWNIEMTLDVIG